MNNNKDIFAKTVIPINLLEENRGQIEGLPANPRQIDEDGLDLLKRNILKYPELLDYNPLKVLPYNGLYVVIGGNMRLRALKELKQVEATCFVLNEETDIERLKAYSILDNVTFGSYDLESLSAWDNDDLQQWGCALPQFDENLLNDFFDEEPGANKSEFKIRVVIPQESCDVVEVIKDEINRIIIEYDGVSII